MAFSIVIRALYLIYEAPTKICIYQYEKPWMGLSYRSGVMSGSGVGIEK